MSGQTAKLVVEFVFFKRLFSKSSKAYYNISINTHY